MGPVLTPDPGEDRNKNNTGSNIKMRFVLMSLAGVLLLSLRAEATMQLMEKMVGEVNTHRLKAECFGEINKNNYDKAIEGAIEKCMQLAPASIWQTSSMTVLTISRNPSNNSNSPTWRASSLSGGTPDGTMWMRTTSWSFWMMWLTSRVTCQPRWET